MESPKINDYLIDKNDPNSKVDWVEYNKVSKQHHDYETSIGKYCYKCGSYQFNSSGYSVLCYSCKNLKESTEEVHHDSYIRCPKCKDLCNVHYSEEYHLFQDGVNEVTCGNCDHDFEVCTSISYSFTSPELLENDADEEEKEKEKDFMRWVKIS